MWKGSWRQLSPSWPKTRAGNTGGGSLKSERCPVKKNSITQRVAYTSVQTAMGLVVLVWQAEDGSPQVLRIFLPSEERAVRQALEQAYPSAVPGRCAEVDELGNGIRAFIAGEQVRLTLQLLALDACSPFQRQVLQADWQIPRGWVSTYGRVARHIGRPGAARAVGRALATNPFPLVIPCHRVLAADGTIGGFQGGAALKRALLQLEGVPFDAHGKVAAERIYY